MSRPDRGLAARAWAAIAGAVLVVGGCSAAAEGTLPEVETHLLVVDDADGSASQGEVISLDSIEGPAVVNVWATNCAPCVREMPALQSVATDRPDVAFYGLNVAESPDAVAEFVDQVGVTYSQLLDPKGEAQEALGIVSLPTTFVVGADGSIATRHRGEITAEALIAALPDPA